MDKLCRICWNEDNWKKPSGKAGKLESKRSFASENGYGHEEWLFNFDWLLSEYLQNTSRQYHYSFLQPLSKFRKTYIGNTFTTYLYTVSPEMEFFIVARIDNLYVPDDDELKWAFKEIISKGWLDIMKQDLRELNLGSSQLGDPNPDWIINIRFRQQDVTFFDPRLKVSDYFKSRKMLRYQPYNFDEQILVNQDSILELQPPENQDDDFDPTRSELLRKRAAIEGTIYNPRHTQLQNPLYRWLCKLNGKQAVSYEKDFVDLSVRVNGDITFYEIKIDNTAKKCIRLALGQLLEYAHYPDKIRADKLIVVGDMNPSSEDIGYLRMIRSLYSIPVYYARWDWEKEELRPEV